jgi:site-specific DNA-methyltransferase (adenine-specific)
MNHNYIQGDCFELFKTIPNNSIDFCLTDPPYFLDGLGDDWDADIIQEKQGQKSSTIKSLPKGMKFDKEQGPRFQEFMARVSTEVFRVLKPGGFFVSFSQARLYHRMTVAVEDSGFEIRDMLGWTYQGQAKAFSQDHIIKKQKHLTEQQKTDLINELQGWKTPQLKPCIEPMCLAQKPTEGKFIDNWQKYGVGLVNVNEQWENSFPGNIIYCNKPLKSEKGDYNNHVSVKPVKLCEHLIKLFTKPGYTVLDPFLGSGTTMIAAERTSRNCVGFELSPKYFSIIQQRLTDEVKKNIQSTDLFEY